MKDKAVLKEEKNLTSELKNDHEEEFNYELEGYATCETASRRCEQDCLGSCFWTCDN